jgi:hypothetical protein
LTDEDAQTRGRAERAGVLRYHPCYFSNISAIST